MGGHLCLSVHDLPHERRGACEHSDDGRRYGRGRLQVLPTVDRLRAPLLGQLLAHLLQLLLHTYQRFVIASLILAQIIQIIDQDGDAALSDSYRGEEV